MKVDPKDLPWKDRDYLVCSKGHAGPILYSTLAMKGLFPHGIHATIIKAGNSPSPSHCLTTNPDPRYRRLTTGSLGPGAPSIAGVGIALGNRDGRWDNYTYLILGRAGEIPGRGQVCRRQQLPCRPEETETPIWSALWTGTKQLDGPIVARTLQRLLPMLPQRFEAFGWNAVTVKRPRCSSWHLHRHWKRAKKSAWINPPASLAWTWEGKRAAPSGKSRYQPSHQHQPGAVGRGPQLSWKNNLQRRWRNNGKDRCKEIRERYKRDARRPERGCFPIAQAKDNKNLVYLDADLQLHEHGEELSPKAYPDRYLNVGIAEANMGIWPPVSPPPERSPFTPPSAFATRRCYDQIFLSCAARTM